MHVVVVFLMFFFSHYTRIHLTWCWLFITKITRFSFLWHPQLYYVAKVMHLVSSLGLTIGSMRLVWFILLCCTIPACRCQIVAARRLYVICMWIEPWLQSECKPAHQLDTLFSHVGSPLCVHLVSCQSVTVETEMLQKEAGLTRKTTLQSFNPECWWRCMICI